MNHLLINFKRFILVLGDILIMFFTLWLALLLRHGADYSALLWQTHWQIFGLLYLVWLPIYYAFNLYDLRANLFVVPLITNLIKSNLVNTVIAIIYFYLISPNVLLTPKTILAINIFLATILIFCWRRLFISLIRNQVLENNLVFIGWDPLIKEIIKEAPALGYQPKAVFNAHEEIRENYNIHLYNNLENLSEIIKQEKIHLAILAHPLSEKVASELFQTL